MIEYDNLYEEINNFKYKNVDEIIFDDIIDKNLEFDLKIDVLNYIDLVKELSK